MGRMVTTTEAVKLTGRGNTAIKAFFKKMETHPDAEGKITFDKKNGVTRRLLDIEVLAKHYPIIQQPDEHRPYPDRQSQPQNSSKSLSIDPMPTAIMALWKEEREQQKAHMKEMLTQLARSQEQQEKLQEDQQKMLENQEKLMRVLVSTNKQVREVSTQNETLKAMMKNASKPQPKKSIIDRLFGK